jgi:hypothetical protein
MTKKEQTMATAAADSSRSMALTMRECQTTELAT